MKGYAIAVNRGSIPACAGEPNQEGGYRYVYEVYPRVCGGTAHKARQLEEEAGLSPRVRGNLVHLTKWPVMQGSIPACAGEPSSLCSLTSRRGVYPRVCGGTAQQC